MSNSEFDVFNTLYPKISGPWAREVSESKKVGRQIYGTWKDSEFGCLASYDYPFVWTEKIDGTNIRVIWDGYNVSFSGRTNRAELPQHLLHDSLKPAFREEVFEELFGDKKVILFGEGYGAKIQSGGAYSQNQKFIGFDVCVCGKYLLPEDMISVFESFGVDIVPYLNLETVEDALGFMKENPDSLISTEPKKMEGVVGRPKYDLRTRFGDRISVKIKPCHVIKNKDLIIPAGEPTEQPYNTYMKD